ncbi:hypothetical protein [Hymenobacter chitinivorans]|uniref:Uncharacterized protein n=1 Tax=Hymenobacter chitinivorans DSM 11115 TaxID=1121954 RepID=A0A2M9BM39_9BACT|nr:hypothetical protein [Hymenobacter chitinivorans]PJJ59026.1 hypothetical protein CLV45_0439 [Hymenobacter chitinivorans DSM 11115]
MSSSTEPYLLFQPNKPEIDTATLFRIKREAGGLRVQNDNVNCLYAEALTPEVFQQAYNFLNKYLFFDFSPVILDGKPYALSRADQARLEQQVITHSIYFYVVNGNATRMKLRPGGITVLSPVDEVIWLLDGAFGADTPVSLALGAQILRQTVPQFHSTVEWKRLYYAK